MRHVGLPRSGDITYGFQYCHHALLVIAQHSHHLLASDAETALDVANLHGISEHACQSEGHPLGVLLALHGNLEAVAKVDVDNLARDAVEHEVRRVAIAETEDVPDHRHDAQGPRVVRSPLQPRL